MDHKPERFVGELIARIDSALSEDNEQIQSLEQDNKNYKELCEHLKKRDRKER